MCQFTFQCCLSELFPEQIYLSYTANTGSEMAVTWVTATHTGSIVKYGASRAHLSDQQSGTTYVALNIANKKLRHTKTEDGMDGSTLLYFLIYLHNPPITMQWVTEIHGAILTHSTRLFHTQHQPKLV